MALKTESPTVVVLPPQLGKAPLVRSACCSANACVVSSYLDTPSISWVAISPLANGGEVLVDTKYQGWQQKGLLMAEWPWAASLFREGVLGSHYVLFVFHLSEKTHRTYELPEEASVLLLMGKELAVVVLKDGFFVVDLLAPGHETFRIVATPLLHPISSLCHSKPTEILLVSMNDMQLWHFEASELSTVIVTLRSGLRAAGNRHIIPCALPCYCFKNYKITTNH